jgi:DNA-binding transcriptional MocR family regulator
MKFMAKMQGIQLVPIPQALVAAGLDPVAMAAFIRQEHLKAMYLVPEQNNPTAETMTPKARQNVAKAVTETDILLIEDAVNRVFCEQSVQPISALAPENACYLFSTAKFMAAGLRVAYIFLPTALKETMSAVYYAMNLMVSPLNLEIVTQVLQSAALAEIINAKRRELHARQALVDQLLGAEVAMGEATCCFRWLQLPVQWTGAQFEKAALARGVQVFGPEKFIVGNLVPPRAVRICISAPKTRSELKRGLQILRDLRDSNVER